MAQYIKTEEGYKGLEESISAVTDNKMDKTNPTGTGSFSMNRKPSTVVGIDSHTEGNWTTASGIDSHAEGDHTTASEYSAHAEGTNTTASGRQSHAEGNSTNTFSSVVTIANPTTEDIITAWTSKKFSVAKGSYSHVEGNNNLALGNYSHAEGNKTVARGYISHAEGQITTASGDQSHAEGNNTTASGQSSHAEGDHTTASGFSSHAEGSRTTASGNSSHAEGNSTLRFSSVVISANPTIDFIMTNWKTQKFSVAKGDYSHVEGKDNLALDNYSHAEGNETIARGYSSHAEGNNTTASGGRSHAEGYCTIANGTDSHVQGKYNIEDTSNKYADIIGNGTIIKRSNAATVDWSGNAWFAGDVYTGSTSGTNKDEGSKKLATEEYVNSSIAATSVLYTEQSLTEEQKAQARQNIGAQDLYNGLTPVSYSCTNGTNSVSGIVYLESGNITSPTENVSDDVYWAFYFLNSFGSYTTIDAAISSFRADKILFEAGYFETGTKWYANINKNDWKSVYITDSTIQFSQYINGQSLTIVYDRTTDTITDASTSMFTPLKYDKNNTIQQNLSMKSDPTEPMQIATKQYVDNAPIKQASATELGGVKADPATESDTQPVRIGEDGKLVTAGGTDISLGLTSASVGQIIKVKAIDESGKPTEWEAAEEKTLKWIKVHESTLTENTNIISVGADESGKELREYNPIGIALVVSTPADATQTNNNGQVWAYPQKNMGDNAIRIISTIAGWKTINRDSIWMWQGGSTALAYNGNNNGASPAYKVNNYAMNGVYAYIPDTKDHFPVGSTVLVSVLTEM